MTVVVVRRATVDARFAVTLGAISVCVACGGIEPSAPPATGGSAGAGGASTSTGGASGTSGASSGGVTSGTGGTTPTGGASGSSSGGTPTGGMPSGGTGGTDAGAGGMSAGTAGMSGGNGATAGAPMGGAGAGGTSSPGGAGGARALSFRADIYPIFDMTRDPIFVYYDGSEFESCTTTGVCHGGQTPGAGLRMSNADEAYSQLMNVDSRSEVCAGTTRVIAGNPAQSCLILFYEQRLRTELEWVDMAEIDLVRRWISEGALP
jgi:hypothetical protein